MEKGNGSSIATVKWNEVNGRYELTIAAVLKGYSQATGEGTGKEAHAEGKQMLIDMADKNGYTVLLDDK